MCGHDKRCAEEGIAHLAPYISQNIGLDVTLQALDMLLRSRFKIHRLRWVNIEEEEAVFVISEWRSDHKTSNTYEYMSVIISYS